VTKIKSAPNPFIRLVNNSGQRVHHRKKTTYDSILPSVLLGLNYTTAARLEANSIRPSKSRQYGN